MLGKDRFAEVLPFLQPAVLDRDTRRAVRDGDWDLDDLMERSTEVTGTEAPELEQIRRVTGKSIAIVALIAFLAYGLISALANVGIQSLWDELTSANLAWLLTALTSRPSPRFRRRSPRSARRSKSCCSPQSDAAVRISSSSSPCPARPPAWRSRCGSSSATGSTPAGRSRSA